MRSASGLMNALALMPPAVKSLRLVRLISAVERRLVPDDGVPVVTNLGISSDLRVEIPRASNPVLRYGHPRAYRGERGGLYLARHLTALSGGFVDVGAHLGYY